MLSASDSVLLCGYVTPACAVVAGLAVFGIDVDVVALNAAALVFYSVIAVSA